MCARLAVRVCARRVLPAIVLLCAPSGAGLGEQVVREWVVPGQGVWCERVWCRGAQCYGVVPAGGHRYGGSRSVCTWAAQTSLLEHSTKAWCCTPRLLFKWGGVTGAPAHGSHVHTLYYLILLDLQ